MDVISLLTQRAKESADKPAFVSREGVLTFAHLRDRVFSACEGLRELGVKKGDRVALYLPTWTEYVISYLAVWCCQATAVPLDFMLTSDELESCIRHCEASVLIAKPKASVSLSELKSRCASLTAVVSCEHGAEEERGLVFSRLLEHAPARLQGAADPKATAIIFYTSGTTGKPKGVLINYRQLSAPPEAMKHFVDLTEKDVTVCALPFSHLGGLIYIQNCLSFGMTVVLMERFIPLEFLKLVSQHRATCFWIVPSMYYAMLQLKEFETFDLSSLRWIVTFGASNSPDALRRFQQYCPQAHLLNGWGLTETNAPTTVIPLGSKKIESVGRPAPWVEVKVFGDDGGEVPVSGVGEVAVRGWVVTEGYYKDPALTSETIRKGWFYTGDLGRFDAEGDLYIVGRKKEMIKVAGEIVFEPEVEAAIHRHPDVAEAAVVGVPDKMRGEVPKAFVACKEGKSLSEEDLRAFLRQSLAHFKVPHYFVFLPSLPKNRTGKVDKAQLRAG
jgi:long-chain acyl-CoA synthetase